MREVSMSNHIVILGAGISGLAMGWFLKKQGLQVTLIEKSSRAGGWIQSINKEGFLFELGPHSCRAAGNGYETLQLIEELNLQDQVILADSSARQRYLFMKQQLVKLPTNPFFFPFSSATKDVLKAIIHDLCTAPNSNEDESIYDFITRRFSSEIAERLVDPIVSGIYAGDMRQLSIASCFPTIYQMEQQYGSVTRGLFKNNAPQQPKASLMRKVWHAGIFSFRNGMETIVRELEKQLHSDITFSCIPKGLCFYQDGIEIGLSNGQKIFASHLVSTLPSHSLADLLIPYHQTLSQKLRNIKHSSVAMVHCGYHQPVLKQRGFGHLIPARENEDILGIIWDSSVFPEQNRYSKDTRLTVMMGGTRHPELCDLSEENCINVALKAIKKHLGIEATPDVVHHAVALHAIPQYQMGHAKNIKEIHSLIEELSPHFLCAGSSFSGVSINDCIAYAKKVSLGLDTNFTASSGPVHQNAFV